MRRAVALGALLALAVLPFVAPARAQTYESEIRRTRDKYGSPDKIPDNSIRYLARKFRKSTPEVSRDLGISDRRKPSSSPARNRPSSPPASLPKGTVAYLQDSTFDVEGRFVSLLGGSKWLLAHSSLILPATDVLVVIHQVEVEGKTRTFAVFHSEGEEVPAEYLSGPVSASTGFLTQVVQSMREGAFLRLATGKIIGIPDYDQYDTGYWMPPYPVLIEGNGLYMWNLEEGQRVWIEIDP